MHLTWGGTPRSSFSTKRRRRGRRRGRRRRRRRGRRRRSPFLLRAMLGSITINGQTLTPFPSPAQNATAFRAGIVQVLSRGMPVRRFLSHVPPSWFYVMARLLFARANMRLIPTHPPPLWPRLTLVHGTLTTPRLDFIFPNLITTLSIPSTDVVTIQA